MIKKLDKILRTTPGDFVQGTPIPWFSGLDANWASLLLVPPGLALVTIDLVHVDPELEARTPR